MQQLLSSHRAARIEPLEPRQLLAADVVLTWNQVLIDALQADTTQPGPGWSSRNAAIVQAAVFDAVNAIDGSYKPYLADVTAPRGASVQAAASAASRALELLYPEQAATFDAALDRSLSRVRDGAGEEAGVAVGRSVAEQIVAARQDDGSATNLPYTPGTEPGDWQPTWPDYTVALGSDWGKLTPFTLPSVDAFAPPAPPDLSSDQYAAAYNQVKELGAKDSTTRTDEQTEIGIFWGYDRRSLGTPVALYNQILATVAQSQRNTLVENARLFALANLAMADGAIVAWEAKYDHKLWRPITAIRNGDTDGNPDTTADPDWEPLGAPGGSGDNFTPPFPSYLSGHATFGGAVFETLRDFYGTDNIRFTLRSEELPGVTRTYDNFSQAAAENSISRIYLGIHWDFDATEGEAAGRDIANHVGSRFLQPQQRPERPPQDTREVADGDSDRDADREANREQTPSLFSDSPVTLA